MGIGRNVNRSIMFAVKANQAVINRRTLTTSMARRSFDRTETHFDIGPSKGFGRPGASRRSHWLCMIGLFMLGQIAYLPNIWSYWTDSKDRPGDLLTRAPKESSRNK